MTAPLPQLGERERWIVERTIACAESDPRFAAVAVVGSRAAGTADAFSDLDFVFVVEDAAFDTFVVSRDSILSAIAEVLWSESWGRADRWFFILANGVEGDLSVIRASEATTALTGPFAVVWDRRGVLTGAQVAPAPPAAASGKAILEAALRGFWHEFGHLTKALGRGQVWWAAGQLEVVRGMCLNLLRLSANFDDPDAGDEPYWKVELSLPAERLELLRSAFSSLEVETMAQAAKTCLSLFRELAEPLARQHGLSYPEALDRIARENLALLDH